VTRDGVSLGPVVGGGVVGATDDVGVGVREGATLVAVTVGDGGTRLAVGRGVTEGMRVGVITVTGGT
jgi:hypothetical protein